MILCMNWNLKMIKDSSCFFPSVSKIHTFNRNFENENKIVTTAIVVTAISKKNYSGKWIHLVQILMKFTNLSIK